MEEVAHGYTSTDWIDPSKIGPPNWLLLEDAFQQMLARAGSGQFAADDLHAWLRSRDWLSVELRVNADDRKTCDRLPADFWRDTAWLEAVPDADAVDHLKIHYPDHVDPSSLSDWHTSFWGRTAEFEHELERLYPAILYPPTAAPPFTAAAPTTKRRRSRRQRMIQQIAAEEFPDGYDQIETGVIIHKVANRLERQRLPVPKRDVFLRALDRRKD
jgi:hypothetical protein